MHPSDKGDEKTTISESQTRVPRNVAEFSERWGNKAVQQEATFYRASTD
jgi:hypothetical protein